MVSSLYTDCFASKFRRGEWDPAGEIKKYITPRAGTTQGNTPAPTRGNYDKVHYGPISNGQYEISQDRYSEFWDNEAEYTQGIYNAYDTDKSGGLNKEEFKKLKADLVKADNETRGIDDKYWNQAVDKLMEQTNEDNGESYTYLDIARLANELAQNDPERKDDIFGTFNANA